MLVALVALAGYFHPGDLPLQLPPEFLAAIPDLAISLARLASLWSVNAEEPHFMT